MGLNIEKWLDNKQAAAEKRRAAKGDYTEAQRHVAHALHYMTLPGDLALRNSLIELLKQFESDVLDNATRLGANK